MRYSTVESYPRAYASGDDIVANLRFALRHEPLDLGVLTAAFAAMPAAAVVQAAMAEGAANPD